MGKWGSGGIRDLAITLQWGERSKRGVFKRIAGVRETKRLGTPFSHTVEGAIGARESLI